MKTNSWIVNLAALTLLLSNLSGCKTYMELKYGLSQPKEETPLKLCSFLEKHHFPEENLYMFSDSSSYYQALRNPGFRRNLLSHMIFDREGIMLQRDTAKCQWAGYDIIKSLSPDSVYTRCSDLNLTEILGHLKPFGKNSTSDPLPGDPDFTLVVTWAKFMGKYNYRLFELSGAVLRNRSARIRLIWLNVDMQESWKLTDKQKMAIR